MNRILSPFLIFTISTIVHTEPLSVIQAIPRGEVANVDHVASIQVVFNQPVRLMKELDKGDPAGFFNISPSVNGRIRWKGSEIFEFVPATKLLRSTEFKITIPKGIKSEVTNQVLQADYTFSIMTPRPQIVSISPTPRQDNESKWYRALGLKEPIFIRFNQPVSINEINRFISIVPQAPLSFSNPPDSQVSSDYMFYVRDDSEIEKKARKAKPRLDVIKIVPQKAWAQSTVYTITCNEGLLSPDGPLGMKDKYAFKFATFDQFQFVGFEHNEEKMSNGETIDPFGNISVSFTNQIILKDLAAHTHFTPESPFYREVLESDWKSFSHTLGLGLKPATQYSILIDKELQDIYGNKLGTDVKFQFQTDDYNPYLKTITGHGVIEAKSPHRIPLEITNVDSVRFFFKKVLPDEMIRMITNKRLFYGNEPFNTFGYGGWTYQTTIAGPLKKNNRARVPVNLDSVLVGGNGAVFMVMRDTVTQRTEKDNVLYHKALLQVTNLGITAKFGYENSLIVVTSLDKGEKKANVDVELRSERNLVLWKGKTDTDGMALAPSWKELGLKPNRWSAPDLFVFARDGNDWACLYSEWGRSIEPYRFGINYSWSHMPEVVYRGSVICERDLYRPGETVYCKGIVRYLDNGYWANPRNTKIALKLTQGSAQYAYDSDSDEGKVVYQDTFSLSKLGSFEFKYEIPKDAKLYTYHWVGKIIGFQDSTDQSSKQYIEGSFRVAEYRPAELDVTVHMNTDNYLFGDKALAKVTAAYLYGAPVVNAPVHMSVRRSPFFFNPKGYEGFAFNDILSGSNEKVEYEDEEEYIDEREDRSSIVWSDSGILDNQGGYTLSIPLRKGEFKGNAKYECEASVQGNTSQPISGISSFYVHSGQFYIGVKPKTQFGEEKKGLPITIITVDQKGDRIAKDGISVQIIRRVWNSVRKAEVDGRFSWVTEKVDSVCYRNTISTSTQGIDTIPFLPPASGFYYVKASAVDSKKNTINASTWFYVTGGSYMAWARSNDDRIDLVADKKNYSPGETANILVKSPYKEVDALVTIEREGIIDKKWVHLQGTADKIVLPIKKEYLPNVFVSVMLIKGRVAPLAFDDQGNDMTKPSFKIGYVNLSVSPQQNHLSVTVSPAQENYRPQDSVTVKIKIPALANKEYASEALVMVVDEGVLILSRYKTPDLFNLFYSERSLCVLTAESRLSIIGERNYGEKGKNRGGGGGFNPKLLSSLTEIKPRGVFKTCAYFNPRVILDKNGEATVTFKLPDNLTTFRIMAVAHSAIGEFGSGDSKIKVNKDLMLRPQLPRFVRCNDVFKAAVYAENRTSSSGQLLTTFNAQHCTKVEPTTAQKTLERNQSDRFSFSATAPSNPDSLTITFSGRLGSATDAVEISIPCIFERQIETVAKRGNTEDKAIQKLIVPENTYEKYGKIETRVSSTALVGLGDGVTYLFEYPYACLEQRTSCVLPLLLFEDIVKAFGVSTLKNNDAASVIREYLVSLDKFVTLEGGFDYWSPAKHASPFVSAYAMLAMIKAEKKGFAVDSRLKKNVSEYLKTVINGTVERAKYPYTIYAWNTIEAFICGVLAEDGYYNANTIERLFKQRQWSSTFGKVFLYRAIAFSKGNMQIRNDLRVDLENSLKLEAATAFLGEPETEGLTWVHPSSVRSTAAMLLVFLESDNNFSHADKVINWLMQQQKNGRWSSTQENLYAFWAMATYFNLYEKAEPDFKAKVKIDGASWFEELFKGRESKQLTNTKSLGDFKRGKECSIEFGKEGPGRLYYELRMAYSPKAPLPSRDEGFSIERTYATLDGKKILPSEFKNGEYVIATITVTTPRERNFVVVNDPIPAGCEIIDPKISVASKSVIQQVESMNIRNEFSNWWGSWTHTEYRDQRCLLFADYMTPGKHTFTYALRTIVSGQFSLPAPYVEAMYNPEIFGRGEVSIANIQ